VVEQTFSSDHDGISRTLIGGRIGLYRVPDAMTP